MDMHQSSVQVIINIAVDWRCWFSLAVAMKLLRKR